MATPNKMPAKQKVIETLKASTSIKAAAITLKVSRRSLTRYMTINRIKRVCTYQEFPSSGERSA